VGMSGLARRLRIGTAALPFVVASLALLWLAAPVQAAEPPVQAPAPSLTDNFSAADQYVESVPTARGPKVPGVGRPRQSQKKSVAKLPQNVSSSLERQPDETSAQLQRIATSPDYGAPAERLRKAKAHSSTRVPAAAVSAVGEGEENTLTWLIVALIGTTVLTAGTAAYRRYQSRNAAG
jgi:hypothetical protein